jgi:pimeloyl-ACP methyl ester carboxylesterase
MTNALEIKLGRAAYRIAMGLGRRALGLRKKTITVDGIDIPILLRDVTNGTRASEGRAGIPIVFIHGFGADKEGWLALIGKLRGRAVVALDLPGFGAASPIDPAHATAEHQARAVKGVLDALHISKAILVGSSMGGGISLRFASDFPEATHALVLLGSVGPLVDKSPLNHALDRGENRLIPRSREDFVNMLDFVAEKKIFAPGFIVSYLASDQVARRDRLQAMFDAWIAQPEDLLDHVLKNVKAPTIVMHGDHDRVIDISSGRAIAERVPNAKLIVLEGIGHVPQFEATGRVARTIKELA